MGRIFLSPLYLSLSSPVEPPIHTLVLVPRNRSRSPFQGLRKKPPQSPPILQLCALNPAPKLTSQKSPLPFGVSSFSVSSSANRTEGLLMLPQFRSTRVLASR